METSTETVDHGKWTMHIKVAASSRGREPGSSQCFWGKVKNEPSILFTAQERPAEQEIGRAVNGKPWASV